MNNATDLHSPAHTEPLTSTIAVPLPSTPTINPIRMCLIRGGEPAYDFASVHGLPVRTYCGDWLYPNVVDEAEATVSPIVDCERCDAMCDGLPAS